MAIKPITPRSMPKTAIKALLHLAEPGAEIVLHSDKCYLLSGDKALYLHDKAFDALLDAGWITPPQAIDSEHANCLITRAGREKARIIKAAMSGYTQMQIFDDDDALELADDGGTPAGRSR